MEDSPGIEKYLTTDVVLGSQCLVSSATHTRSRANLQCEPRRRCLSDHLFCRSKQHHEVPDWWIWASVNLRDWYFQGISNRGSSMAYSVSKAAGLQLMKNLAFTQGPKIRVNAILPGLMLTEWVCLSILCLLFLLLFSLCFYITNIFEHHSPAWW